MYSRCLWLGFVVVLMGGACGGSAPLDQTSAASPPPAEPPPAPSYTDIAPAIYMGAGNECAIRLEDETDGALTAMVGNPGGRAALAVCARQESSDWVMVDGTLGVESITGEASIVPRPPDNASMFAGAPASLDALAVGHIRITAAFAGLTGAGVIEVVAE